MALADALQGRRGVALSLTLDEKRRRRRRRKEEEGGGGGQGRGKVEVFFLGGGGLESKVGRMLNSRGGRRREGEWGRML